MTDGSKRTTPRKRKRDKINPTKIVRLGTPSLHLDGSVTYGIVMPDVPADMVPEIGRACARAILAVLKWPDKDADAMTERVVEQMKADMIEEERELRRVFGAGRNDLQDQAQPPEGATWDRRRGKGDLDDDIPF